MGDPNDFGAAGGGSRRPGPGDDEPEAVWSPSSHAHTPTPEFQVGPSSAGNEPPHAREAVARPKASHSLGKLLLISGILFGFFFLVTGFLYSRGFSTLSTGKSATGTTAQASIFSNDQIGLIEVKGVILESKRAIQELEDMEEDPAIKGVVLRLNSPGGAVAPSQEIYEAVKRFKKPLVVSMASVAASGAYYIASGAKKVFANAGTLTGSIGVIMSFANLEKLYEWAKITRYSIKTGKFKDVGADYRTMTPEEREFLQQLVDNTLAQFKSAVKAGRKLTQDQVDQVADGRIFTGEQAKNLKLVDEIGTLHDATMALARELKIEGKPKVIRAHKKRHRWMEFILDEASDDVDSDSEERAPLGQLSRVLARVLGDPLASSSSDRMESGVYFLWRP